jgi:hypothetical protein
MGPGQVPSNIRFMHKFRFTVVSTTTGTGITGTDLLGMIGGMGKVVNTSVSLIAESVKIKRIQIWSPPASQGANATCSVNWAGFQNTPNTEVSDTTVSVTKPAYINCKPPAQSLASFWQGLGSTTIFGIAAVAGSILEIFVDVVLNDTEVSPVTVPVATAVVGQMYYLALDGPSLNNFIPVYLASTH